MVKSCCVYKCTNRYNSTSKFSGISFFRFPKDKRQRRAWIKAINRENWAPNDNTWVCSVHFIDGWHGYDPSDQNYAPTLFSYKAAVRDVAQVARDSRKLERQQSKEAHEKQRDENVQEECHKRLSLYMHSNYCDIPSDHEPDHGNETTNVMKTKDAGTLCDPDPLSKENEKLQEELRETKRDLQRERWGVHRIADNDSLTKFYTSLPTFAMFLWLFSYLKDKCERMTYWTGESHTLPGTDRTRAHRSHLQPIDQLLAVLMRNRLGLFVQDIAERFCIAPSTFSKYYTTWLCLLHKELKFLNPFPDKDVVQRTMPSQFKKFPNTRIIIDCTEIFIQKSSSLTNQSLTFSNYKNHNTAKFLVGITPSGIISFVSEGWGGKVSD
ncbi:uncharacterized protein LOC125659816 [Ostrea edulis]|uniref:uncharacterized protein LOC125659816 n=1 Tax=Ostrea edulis TaxID=37623 RepID=UPI0024AF044F|nr:uncharacterized protein LOC125659816 [Ostrea edulis]